MSLVPERNTITSIGFLASCSTLGYLRVKKGHNSPYASTLCQSYERGEFPYCNIKKQSFSELDGV